MAIPLRHNDFGHFRQERGGRQCWVLRATCTECHKQGDAVLSGSKATLSQDFANKLFRNKGWELGKDRLHDRCPDCIETEIANRRAAQNKALEVLPKLEPADPMTMKPEDRVPRIRLNKPLDWTPTQDEISAFLRDTAPADGSDPRKRHSELVWYPQITHGGEAFVWSLMETRLRQNDHGLFVYEVGWTDERVCALITQLVPGFQINSNSLRQIRVQKFGPMRRSTVAQMKGATAISAPPQITAADCARALPPPVILEAPQQALELVKKETGVVVPFEAPTYVPAPENALTGDIQKTLDRVDGDLITLFEEQEKVKASFSMVEAIGAQLAGLMERIADVESKAHTEVSATMKKIDTVACDLIKRVSALEHGKSSKSLHDYTISELLAEIARRHDGGDETNVVKMR